MDQASSKELVQRDFHHFPPLTPQLLELAATRTVLFPIATNHDRKALSEQPEF